VLAAVAVAVAAPAANARDSDSAMIERGRRFMGFPEWLGEMAKARV
jgi:hypothetical protein